MSDLTFFLIAIAQIFLQPLISRGLQQVFVVYHRTTYLSDPGRGRSTFTIAAQAWSHNAALLLSMLIVLWALTNEQDIPTTNDPRDLSNDGPQGILDRFGPDGQNFNPMPTSDPDRAWEFFKSAGPFYGVIAFGLSLVVSDPAWPILILTQVLLIEGLLHIQASETAFDRFFPIPLLPRLIQNLLPSWTPYQYSSLLRDVVFIFALPMFKIKKRLSPGGRRIMFSLPKDIWAKALFLDVDVDGLDSDVVGVAPPEAEAEIRVAPTREELALRRRAGNARARVRDGLAE